MTRLARRLLPPPPRQVAYPPARHPAAHAEVVPVLESAFQANVVAAFRQCGWAVYHTHRSERSEPGFPDLVAVHAARQQTIYAELKGNPSGVPGTLTAEQIAWLTALTAAGNRCYAWWPWHADEAFALAVGATIETRTGRLSPADVPCWPYREE